MSLILGRPRTINTSDCSTKTPLVCDMPANPTKTIPMARSASDAPSNFMPNLFQYAIGIKMHEAMNLGVTKRYIKDYGIVGRIHTEVVALLDELPPSARPDNPDTSWDTQHPRLPTQRQNIASTLNSYLLAIHRPHANSYPASRQAAIEAALRTLEAQQRIFEMVASQFHRSFFLTIYTIDAAIFLSAVMIECAPADPAISEKIRYALQQGLYRLGVIKAVSSVAKSGEQVLLRCFQKIHERNGAQVVPDQAPVVRDRLLTTPPTSTDPPLEVTSGAINNDRTFLQDFQQGTRGNLDILDDSDMFGTVTDPAFNAALWMEQFDQLSEPWLHPDSDWNFSGN